MESGIIARKKRSGKVESGKVGKIMIEIGEIMMQWKIFAIKGGNFAKLKILNM